MLGSTPLPWLGHEVAPENTFNQHRGNPNFIQRKVLHRTSAIYSICPGQGCPGTWDFQGLNWKCQTHRDSRSRSRGEEIPKASAILYELPSSCGLPGPLGSLGKCSLHHLTCLQLRFVPRGYLSSLSKLCLPMSKERKCRTMAHRAEVAPTVVLHCFSGEHLPH